MQVHGRYSYKRCMGIVADLYSCAFMETHVRLQVRRKSNENLQSAENGKVFHSIFHSHTVVSLSVLCCVPGFSFVRNCCVCAVCIRTYWVRCSFISNIHNLVAYSLFIYFINCDAISVFWPYFPYSFFSSFLKHRFSASSVREKKIVYTINHTRTAERMSLNVLLNRLL